MQDVIYADGNAVIIRERPAPYPRFKVGKTYRTKGGKRVKIIAESTSPPGYECVQGDDISGLTGVGIWRYNRPQDMGRVCGSPHDFSDPNNLILGEPVWPGLK